MPGIGLVILLSALFLTFAAFLFFIVTRKIHAPGRTKQKSDSRIFISQNIETFVHEPEAVFKKGLDEFVRDAENRGGTYLEDVDDYLLFALESPAAKNPERYITLARRLDFAAKYLTRVRSRDPVVSASGARGAGLYHYTEAAEDMIAALDSSSGENEFEILMGLSRMGEGDALRRAFGKIKKNITLNERAVICILQVFPEGESKTMLFKTMIARNTGDSAALFINAADRNMVLTLFEEIKEGLAGGNKETRAAAARALGRLGSDAPADELIQAMEDHEWEVRALTARALEHIKTSESSMVLFRALFDKQWWVRQHAAFALITHPGYEALFMLAAESDDGYAKGSIIWALENGGSLFLLRSAKIMAALES